MTTKAVVLLSGGQDSTTALFWAKHNLGADVELHALTVDYGQRHSAEVDAADHIAQLAECKSWRVVDLRDVFGAGSGALVNHDEALTGDGGIVDGEMPQGLPSSFVPGRNLVFLAVAAARAGEIGAMHVVSGVCQTDYSGYPDCREDFVHAMEAAVNQAMPTSRRPIALHVPLMHKTKAETVRLMQQLARGEPFDDIRNTAAWKALARSVTCYDGLRPGCGVCPACVLRASGFAEALVSDPAGKRGDAVQP